MPKSLISSSRYNKFVRARNLLLEAIHIATQKKLAMELDQALEIIKGLVGYRFENLKATGLYSPQGKHSSTQLQSEIDRVMRDLGVKSLFLIKKMRRHVYVLSHMGEAEAIAQAINKPLNYSLTADKLNAVENSEAFSSGHMEDRVQYILNKLARKIMSAVELSVLDNSSHEEMLQRLEMALPKTRKVKKKAIKKDVKVTEADSDPTPDMSQGYIDDETWDEILEQYKDEFVPDWRGPKSVVWKAGKEEIYAWELEKEITQDFVYQVRSGQVDAAKENGINDYVWVAVVDNVTDDCCLWRDGLTTKEIEKKLKTTRRDDACQTIVPPAHFNCRCVLAPMVDEMPDRPESNEKDFEEWMNT